MRRGQRRCLRNMEHAPTFASGVHRHRRSGGIFLRDRHFADWQPSAQPYQSVAARHPDGPAFRGLPAHCRVGQSSNCRRGSSGALDGRGWRQHPPGNHHRARRGRGICERDHAFCTHPGDGRDSAHSRKPAQFSPQHQSCSLRPCRPPSAASFGRASGWRTGQGREYRL